MCLSLKEEVYKEYLVNVFNHYDKNETLSLNDFKLTQITYQP